MINPGSVPPNAVRDMFHALPQAADSDVPEGGSTARLNAGPGRRSTPSTTASIS